jgi:phosphoglycerol transferase MdoB-like AlkP superfamily enzyme
VRERQILSALAEPDAALPGLAWQLLFPVGAVAGALLLPTRARWLTLGVVGIALSLLFASDLAYHRFFGTVPSAFMLSSATQLFEVHASITSLLSWGDLAPALLFAPFFALAFWSKPTACNDSLSRNPRVWGLVLIAANLGLSVVASKTPIYEPTHHIGRPAWVAPAEHWGSRYSRLTHATTFGLLNYHTSDLFDFLANASGQEAISETRLAEINQTLDHKKELNDATSPLFGIARGRHVILLQLESFQHFLLDLEVAGHEVTPTLNRLEKSALNWDSIFDVTHIGRTSDAEFAVMTGLLPDVRKPAALNHLADDLVTLPKQLASAGYQTSSIHGFKRSFWNRAYSHPAFGIDDMFFAESFDASDPIGLGPSDRQVFGFAADLLEERRATPQMQLVISLTSHHPYLFAPREYVLPYAHLDPSAGFGLLGPYLASASYTDAAVGVFLEDLEAKGLLNESLIVIYGDHDRGGLGAQHPLPEVGPRMFETSEDRVPFMILVPGLESQIAELREPFTHVMGGLHDLFPTVSHLLGMSIPRGVLGTHLFVENQFRDPLPLPGPSGVFGYHGGLALGDGRVLLSRGAIEDADKLPSLDVVMRDRRLLQDLLDHYDEIRPGSPANHDRPTNTLAASIEP